MSRLRLIVATAVALVLLLPATALAASFEVSGTVTDKGGAAVAGAEVTILVQGTDMVFATTTDANGAWAITVDADGGAILEVNGTGPTTTTGPDEKGCMTSTTGSGQTSVELPAEGTPDAVALVLDNEISGTVCAATAKPDSPQRPAVTPPATDTIGAGAASSSGTGMLLLLGGLAAFTLLTVTFAARRR